ncbi:MAG TPA: thiamine phosphate synthase [Terriglobales bacterium]|jgi:thiamine-phosphate pyrophosphorylase|nr:thiamine phosphate synthase [Terriglobales bacterium]
MKGQHSANLKRKLPRFYAIIDAGRFADGKNALRQTVDFAQQLLEGGATLIQYRNKKSGAREMLSQVRELRRVAGAYATLIMNDRADLCLASGCDGVHVGQEDLSVEGARNIVGETAFVGISTHNMQQILQAAHTSADYIAVGPVFATKTKMNPEPVVGLELIRTARKTTSKPIVAIGGITNANCRSVIEAGADSIAVISGLQASPREGVEQFLRELSVAD